MIKVAIVEGNQTVRQSLETIVNLAPGCRCIGTSGTADEALQTLRNLQPDVVLVDTQSPGRRGVERTVRMQESLPATRIIALTVYEDPDRIFRALKAGACGYLLKRSTPEQIIAMIRQAHRAEVTQPHAKVTDGKNSPFGELGKKVSTARLASES